MIPKDKVITSLQTAQVELDKALEQLARCPPTTPAACGLPPTR